MLEALLSAKPVSIGVPGPTDLVGGTEAAGFYGQVSASELITGSALAKLGGLNAGVMINDDSGWLKFAYQGKVLMVAQKTFRHTVSWNQLSNAKVIFGDTTVVIRGMKYRLRLMTGGDANPYTTKGGEWSALMLRVVATGSSGDNWAVIPNADLFLFPDVTTGGTTWCQESYTTADQALCRGHYTPTNFGPFYKTQASNYLAWRPVLELVP